MAKRFRLNVKRSSALDRNYAIVGAYNEDGGSGAAYVYDISDTSNPLLLERIANPDADDGGAAVALEGSTALIGAHHGDGASGTNSGTVHVYDFSGLMPNDAGSSVPAPAGMGLLAMGAAVLAKHRR